MDSPAFAALSSSAVRLLLLMARQLDGTNNGQLHAAFSWCSVRGFGSHHTLRDALAELIAHGFVYRTRSSGANQVWAKYALTWLPIGKQREGLFLDGFKPDAWKEWEPPATGAKTATYQKKSRGQKLPQNRGKNCHTLPESVAETAAVTGAKTATYELMPCRSRF